MLNLSQMQFICESISRGLSIPQIASTVHCSEGTVYNIRNTLKSRRFLTTSGDAAHQRMYWLSSDPINNIAKEIYHYYYD